MRGRYHIPALLLLTLSACAGAPDQPNVPASSTEESRPLPGVLDATRRACPEPRGDAMTTWRSRVSRGVTNGTTFDCGALQLDDVDRLVVPTDAVIERVDDSRYVVIRVRRTLNFAGHTGSQELNPSHARENMGVAWHLRGRTVRIGTFGEFDTRIEGGAGMALHIEVPEGFSLERSADISGPWSTAAAGESAPELAHGRWFGPTLPAMNWHRVSEQPDPTGAMRTSSYWRGPPRGAPDNPRKVARDCVREHAPADGSVTGHIVAVIFIKPQRDSNTVRTPEDTVEPEEVAACLRDGLSRVRLGVRAPSEVTVKMRFVFE